MPRFARPCREISSACTGTSPSSRQLDESGMSVAEAGARSSWSIYPPRTPREEKAPLPWKSFATSFTPNPITFGYCWNEQLTRKSGSLVTLPEYYRLDSNGKTPEWSVVSPRDVPTELGLTQYRFETAWGR